MPTCVNLTADQLIATQSTYNTASISPAGNKLLLVWVNSIVSSGTPNDPTITGDGVTWVKIASVTTGTAKVSLFRGMVSSPSSGALTIDFAAQSQLFAQWIVDQVDGIDTSGSNGANAVVQSATQIVTSGASSTGISATLAAFGSTNNATYGGARKNGSNTLNPGSNFTQSGSIQDGATGHHSVTEFTGVNQTTVDFNWTSEAVTALEIAIEIKAAPVAPSSAKGYAFFM